MRATAASRQWVGAVLGGALLGALAQPAAALDFSLRPNAEADVHAILAKGRIEDGDTHDLKRFIAKLPAKPRIVVYLDSPGGSLHEGMALGTFFHRHRISTMIAGKTRCTSACALAFLGGRGRDGQPLRVKASSAGLGLHSFSRDFPRDRTYSADDLKLVLQKAQSEVGVVAEYLRSIDADMDLLRVMVTATSKQMNFLSNDQAIAMGILVFDEKANALVDPKPVLERIARAKAEARLAAAAVPVPPIVSAEKRRNPGPTAGQADSPAAATPAPTARRMPASPTARTADHQPSSSIAESGARSS